MEDSRTINGLLGDGNAKGPGATDRLMPMIYDKLRAHAGRLIQQEHPGHMFQPTALVHEAYLRLARMDSIDWKGRTHFMAMATRIMRQVLVDHARQCRRTKRGGCAVRLSFQDTDVVRDEPDTDILALNDALERLRELDGRQFEVVELRCFGGMTVEEVAEALGLSKRTIEREWTMAKAWLKQELAEGRKDDAATLSQHEEDFSPGS